MLAHASVAKNLNALAHCDANKSLLGKKHLNAKRKRTKHENNPNRRANKGKRGRFLVVPNWNNRKRQKRPHKVVVISRDKRNTKIEKLALGPAIDCFIVFVPWQFLFNALGKLHHHVLTFCLFCLSPCRKRGNEAGPQTEMSERPEDDDFLRLLLASLC